MLKHQAQAAGDLFDADAEGTREGIVGKTLPEGITYFTLIHFIITLIIHHPLHHPHHHMRVHAAASSSSVNHQLQQLSASIGQLGSRLSALELSLDQQLSKLSATSAQEGHAGKSSSSSPPSGTRRQVFIIKSTIRDTQASLHHQVHHQGHAGKSSSSSPPSGTRRQVFIIKSTIRDTQASLHHQVHHQGHAGKSSSSSPPSGTRRQVFIIKSTIRDTQASLHHQVHHQGHAGKSSSSSPPSGTRRQVFIIKSTIRDTQASLHHQVHHQGHAGKSSSSSPPSGTRRQVFIIKSTIRDTQASLHHQVHHQGHAGKSSSSSPPSGTRRQVFIIKSTIRDTQASLHHQVHHQGHAGKSSSSSPPSGTRRQVFIIKSTIRDTQASLHHQVHHQGHAGKSSSSSPPSGTRRQVFIIKSTIRDTQSLVTQLERFDVTDSPGQVNSSTVGHVNVSQVETNSTHRPPPADDALTGIQQENRSMSQLRNRYQQQQQRQYQRRFQQQQQQQQNKQLMPNQQQNYQQQNQLLHQQRQQLQQQQPCAMQDFVIEEIAQRLEKSLTRSFAALRASINSDVTTSLADVIHTSEVELRNQHRVLTQLILEQATTIQRNLTLQLKEQTCICNKNDNSKSNSDNHKDGNENTGVDNDNNNDEDKDTSSSKHLRVGARKGTSGAPSRGTAEHASVAAATSSSNGQWAAMDRTSQPTCSPDVSTVAALSEVKVLLRSVLSASEDLRRSIRQQTTEGLDQLQLLHRRFAALLGLINSDPDNGQSLASELQELENLVENSYTSILHAQNVFIASCHRIQDEEPLVEAKIADILDKIVTSIELGQQYNREQLGELRQLVHKMGSQNTSMVTSPYGYHLTRVSPNMDNTLMEAWIQVVRGVNSTSDRLGAVAGRVAQVQNNLISTTWTALGDRKDLVDQLLTSAKDLYGYARNQLQVLSDLSFNIEKTLSSRPPPEIPSQSLTLRDFNPKSLTEVRLPHACTEALRPLLRFQALEENRATDTVNGVKADRKASASGNTDDDDAIPAWYTDPDIVSGNYGTPQRRFPSFREDDWPDQYDEYSQDYQDANLLQEETDDNSVNASSNVSSATNATVIADPSGQFSNDTQRIVNVTAVIPITNDNSSIGDDVPGSLPLGEVKLNSTDENSLEFRPLKVELESREDVKKSPRDFELRN
ncbi:uncharacterized protein LOC108680025 [Hyalella azteca]|uniref:Uncharacterized protein LOC108680025 n=1 Tax=Hyalella azteca TaxID=294128 RepID=A0A8B7PE34_HYAAZ|nr:uncharacterized protein LOC108680025 [Hyalella azteca]